MPLKAKSLKNSEEFVRFVEKITGKPFKALPSVDGKTAYKYLSGVRNWANLFTDSDLIAILNDKHRDGGLLYIFGDHSSVVYKPKIVQ